MMRITTNGSLFTYRYNLKKTTNLLNNSMTKVMTGRNFSSYCADPAAATRAFKIHSSLNSTNAQYSNNQTVLSKYETAWSNLEGILDDLTRELGEVPALEGLNGTNLDNLQSQAQILRSGAEAIVQSMNGKYDEDFIFAGSDNKNAPFAIDDAGFITYQGVRIDDPDTLTQNYLLDPDDPASTVENPVTHQPYTNEEMLKVWAEEDPLYVDIGLGFELGDDGKVIDSTAFDASISGIDILGYGLDEDGDPKNLASIMFRLADVFDGYDPETKTWNNGSEEDASRLVNKLRAAQSAVSDKHAELDAEAKFLNTNSTQLESNFDALNVELESIERVDQADAIMELVWAQTCFSAALQVGVNVIPQSLMDYMQ